MTLSQKGGQSMLKRLLVLSLSALMLLGSFTACGGQPPEETQIPTTTAQTEPEEEAKVMKVLTLGNSAAVDSNHMINLVSHTEGLDKELVIGTLYYSGCTLAQHVKFMNSNEPVYKLYISSTATPNLPPEGIEDVTMADALRHDYWDVIVLQGGGGLYEASTYTNGDIQAIQAFANEHKLNPNAVFAWHFFGAPASDPELLNTYPKTPNPYVTRMTMFGNSRRSYFEACAVNYGKYIYTDDSFEFVICSGTAGMNASTTYLTEKDLIRDYFHTTDLGRLITSYVWYATLAGIEQLQEIKLDAIPKAFLKSTQDKSQDRPLTEAEKAIILESVNNALKNPLEITQSQYTQAPTE
jgi:hypothetical protein